MVDLSAKPFHLSQRDIDWVEKTKRSMTLDEKIGQLFCPIGITTDSGYLAMLTQRMHIGGILFREMNGVEVQQAHRMLQKSSRIPLLIAANVETGGDGIASDGTGIGEQMSVAATEDAVFAEKLGEIAAEEGAAVGLNWAFGPVMDIDFNYRNPITNVRTFGSDVDRVIELGKKTREGLERNGLVSCIKHFPGDGVDDRDQHLVTSVNSLSKSKWEATYGRIFRTMIEDGVLSIMTGHIQLPAYQTDGLPASLSKDLLKGLLRGELQFNGLVITDATPMVGFCAAMSRQKAVPYAIEAGCDMFLFNKDMDEDFAFMKKGIEDGILSKQRLDEALTRILGLKAAMKLHERQQSGTLVPEASALEVLGCPAHIETAEACADQSITLVKDSEGILPISRQNYKRILLEILGDFPSNQRVQATLESRLKNEGFEVTVYQPEDFSTLDNNVTRFKTKYDLVLYIGNIENISNRTVSRIHWHTFFGNGNNVPWFVKEIPSIFVSVGNPYLLQDVPMIPTYINAYFNSDIVLEAVVDKLLGKSVFKGKSPIDPFCGRDELR